MKSTLKVDYERSKENYPVIKIVIPDTPISIGDTPGFKENLDEDVRDKLLRDFLHTPLWEQPNSLFEVKTTFPVDGGRLTTIGAVREDDMFYGFRHSILNRLVPYETILSINIGEINNIIKQGEEMDLPDHVIVYNKINQFFDWVDKQDYCSFLERSPQEVSHPCGNNRAKYFKQLPRI